MSGSVDFITGNTQLWETVKMPELIEKRNFGTRQGWCLPSQKEYERGNMGFDGYRITLIWEDDFEKCITDTYTTYSMVSHLYLRSNLK